MASKKMKQSMAEFNTAKPAESADSSDTGKTILETLEAKAPAALTEKTFNEQVKQQLAATETLASENARLSEENLLLKEKLADYISEIAELKSSKDGTALDNLREENDNYLMKISELTFENAKLTASVNELKSKLEAFDHAVKTGRAKNLPSRSSHGPCRTSDGYTSWN